VAGSVELDAAAVVWSRPPSEREHRPLILLLHGFGSNETDLASLVPELPPEAAYASLRAPLPEGPGFAWFTGGLDDLATPRPENVENPVNAVLSWLDRYSRASKVGLVGFSQGGSIALSLMRHEPARFPFAAVLSSHVVGEPLPGDDTMEQARPPVFWGRGTDDPLIPQFLIQRTRGWLESHTRLDEHAYPGLGHGVSQRELVDLRTFVQRQLPTIADS
jgi:phospholipase/carboxylesterase